MDIIHFMKKNGNFYSKHPRGKTMLLFFGIDIFREINQLITDKDGVGWTISWFKRKFRRCIESLKWDMGTSHWSL